MRCWYMGCLLVVGCLVPKSVAQGPPAMGMGDRSPFSYQATWLPARNVSGQTTDFTVVRQQLNTGFPIFMGEQDRVLGIFTARMSLFETDAVLPDSQRAFPSTLSSIQLGTMYSHTFDNGWTATGLLSVNSTSDIPFHGLREINPTILGSLTVPTTGESAWLFSLFYSPAGQFLFPLPGVAYRWVMDETLQITLGIPFSVRWRPITELTFDLSYTPLTNVRTRVTWNIDECWSVYGGYEWANETWQLVDRIDRQERFYGNEMRLEAGVTGELIERWRTTLFGGYAFERQYWRGRNFFRNRLDELTIEAGPYLGARLEFRF